MHVPDDRPRPIDLAKALVMSLAVTTVPLSVAASVLVFLGIAQPMATPIESEGGNWYSLAVGIFMGPFVPIVCGVFLTLALWFGWTVSRFLRRWFPRKRGVAMGGVDGVEYPGRRRDDLDFLRYFPSLRWFRDLFFGLLAFLAVVFPISWGVAASMTRHGLWYYVDVLAILSLAIATPVMALGSAVTVWMCTAVGVLVIRALGLKSLRWMKEAGCIPIHGDDASR